MPFGAILMRSLKRFSIRSMLIAVLLVSVAFWLFLPLIRGDAYAEYKVLDLSITPSNEIQIVTDAKITRNCLVGFSAPASPIIGATPEPRFLFPGWPESRQVFYIGKLATGTPNISDFKITKGQIVRLDARNPDLVVFANPTAELKLTFKRQPH